MIDSPKLKDGPIREVRRCSVLCEKSALRLHPIDANAARCAANIDSRVVGR